MNANEMLVKAKLARSFFIRKTRDSGESFTCTKDETPDWVTDLCHDAHNEMLPDDFVYSTIEDSLDAIIEAGGDEVEAIELECDIYNRDLLAWLASHSSRVDYTDQAAEEFGSGGIITLISQGQYLEKRDILANVVRSLENLEIEELDGLE